jgi:hypothetical protein
MRLSQGGGHADSVTVEDIMNAEVPSWRRDGEWMSEDDRK